MRNDDTYTVRLEKLDPEILEHLNSNCMTLEPGEPDCVDFSVEHERELLMKIRQAASAVSECIGEFPHWVDDCSDCFEALDNALYASRELEPKLLAYFTE